MDESYQTRSSQPKLTCCWTRDETCLLLKILRKYPLLYDPNHPDYGSKVTRNKIFQQISDELKTFKPDINPMLVKNKFKVLRQQYLFEQRMKNDFLTKRNKYDGVPYKPKLWCYTLMKFFEEKCARNKAEIRNVQKPSFSTILLNQNEDSETLEDISSDIRDLSRNILNAKCLELVDDLANTLKEVKEEREAEKSSDEPPQTFLGLMIESELSKVNEDVYDEAKWKIIRILEEASKRHRAAKNASIPSSQFKTPPFPITILPSIPDAPAPNKQLYLGNGVKVVTIKSPGTLNFTTTKFNNIDTSCTRRNK